MELKLEQRQKLLDRIVVDLECLVDGTPEDELVSKHWTELCELNELVDALVEEEGVIVESSQGYAIGRQTYWDIIARRKNEIRALVADRDHCEEAIQDTITDYYEELRTLDDTMVLLREDLCKAKAVRDKYFDLVEEYNIGVPTEWE